jgi:hypothetical protein
LIAVSSIFFDGTCVTHICVGVLLHVFFNDFDLGPRFLALDSPELHRGMFERTTLLLLLLLSLCFTMAVAAAAAAAAAAAVGAAAMPGAARSDDGSRIERLSSDFEFRWPISARYRFLHR